uniref:Putative zn finger n=1 Tax=Lutzomyia longipalpis TaxID=7200 RepID=A0A1B0CGG1_LUTLO
MTPIYYKVPAVPQINRRPKNPAVVDAKTKQEKQKAAFTCERCGKTLTNRQGFLMHMDKHNNTARYKCDQCDQKFIHWLSRRTHIYRVHLKKPYCTCQHCGKSFYQIKDMRTHILEFHTAEHKGYQCEICGKNFRTRSSFNDHKNVHKSGVECKVCGKMLKTKKTYFKHLEGHTGARHYACSVCDRTYTCNNLLKRHMKHKHPDKIHLLPPSGTIVNKAYLKKKGLQHPIPHPQQSTSQNSLSLKLTK